MDVNSALSRLHFFHCQKSGDGQPQFFYGCNPLKKKVRFDAGFKERYHQASRIWRRQPGQLQTVSKNSKIMDMYMSQNAIIITKVANGWAVQLPMTQKLIGSLRLLSNNKPLIREALRMREGILY